MGKGERKVGGMQIEVGAEALWINQPTRDVRRGREYGAKKDRLEVPMSEFLQSCVLLSAGSRFGE